MTARFRSVAACRLPGDAGLRSRQDQDNAPAHLPMTRADLSTSSPPAWLGWVGAGLTAMLAVLFLVLVQQLRAQNVALVVAPETAVPLLPFQLKDSAPGYWETLVEHFKAPGRSPPPHPSPV